jgi:hypothetical protein
MIYLQGYDEYDPNNMFRPCEYEIRTAGEFASFSGKMRCRGKLVGTFTARRDQG